MTGRPRRERQYAKCAQCGTPIEAGRRADAKFCASPAPCKNAYSNARFGRELPVGVLTRDPTNPDVRRVNPKPLRLKKWLLLKKFLRPARPWQWGSMRKGM